MPLPFAPLGSNRNRGTPAPRMPFSPPSYRDPASSQGAIAAGVRASFVEDAAKAEAKRDQIAIQNESLAQRERAAQQRQVDQAARTQETEAKRVAAEAAKTKRADDNRELARAEFQAAALPPVMTPLQRADLEAEHTKKDKALRARAAARLQETLLTDPEANATTGGFLGMGGEPTPRAAEIAQRLTTLADPANLNDSDLEEFRKIEPTAFDERDTLKKRLEADSVAQTQRDTVTRSVARAKALKAGVPESELDTLVPPTGALPGADPWQRVAQAGALERDNAQVAQLAQGIEAGKTELADIDAQIEGITAEASKGGSATQVMQSQEANMQLRQQRDQKAQALQATIERHNSQLTAIEAKSRALNEQAEAAKAPVADEAPKPAVPLASAKAAAKLEADGSYSTSQIDNLQSLSSAGVKAYWADPQTTTKATPESREAKTKAVNDSIDTVQKLGADLTASAQEIQRRIEDEVRSGRLAPEAAQREQEKAFAEYEKSHEEQIVARGEYLHSALRDFSEGQIDADTLNAVYHAAGGSQTGVEAFAELQTQLKKDAEHVDALTAVILGEDGKGSADPGLNGQLLGLAATAAEGSAKYAQWLNAGDYPQGMSQGEITASESNAQAGAEDAKKAKAEMERLRTEQHNKLAAELVKRGADAGQIPGLIAQAELQSLAKARPGIASVVASRGGITAFTAEKLPFVGGLVEAARILPYAETALKLENGEAVTPEEMQALGEFVRFTQEKPSLMASVTDGVASLPGFAIELYSTAGIAGAVRKGGNKAIKEVLERVATKQGRARLAAQMAKSSADNVVAAWSKNNAKKAFGVKLLRVLAEEAVRLPVASAGRIVSKYTQDLATEGVNVTNEDGHMAAVIDSDQRSKPLLRVANAVIDSYIENVSERSGFLLGKILGGKFLASKLSALSKAAKSKLVSVAMFKAFVRANPGAAPGKIAKILKGANIGSVPEEMFEERLGSAARDVWNGLSGKGWESTVIPSPEDFGVEFLTFLVPGAHAAIQTQRHFGKLDRAITASDSEATSHMDGFASDPAAHAQRLSQLVGAPISADDITRATDLTGPVHQSDAVRTNDRMQIDLMTRSEEALNQGQIEKASKLRQMALDQSRQKSRSADGELLQGISAAGEIDGLHAAAEEIRTQASQLPDQQQQAAAMLRADDMELMGDRISALVKVATGREAVLTQNEKEALNHPSMKPAVVEENGALIITDEARDQMEQFAPTAAKYVKQSETMRREQLGQAAAVAAQPATQEAPTPTAAPAEQGTAPAPSTAPAPAATAAEPQWTATGDKGTVVSIPASEAKTRAQAEAKLVSKLPKGENLRGGTLQKPKAPKPTPEATTAAPEPAPIDYGTGETFDSGKFADVAKARAAKLKNPKAKAHYERVVDAIAKAVKSRGKAFPNGVKLDYTMKDGGGAMLKGGALVVNPDLIGTQTTELSDDELNAWVSAVSSEEFIHLAQVQSLSTKQAEQRWNKLGSTKAGKKLQATSQRAYFAAYEARGEKPPAQTAANAYFELTRQIIQGKIDANLVTETMIGDKTFAAELLDFLKSIADYLNKALAKLPKADRADIEADIAKISATMAKLEGSLTTNETDTANESATPENAPKTTTEAAPSGGNAAQQSGKAPVATGDKNALTIVRLSDGTLAHVRVGELGGNGDTLRAFDPVTRKPIKGAAGSIARANIALTPIDNAAPLAKTSLSNSATSIDNIDSLIANGGGQVGVINNGRKVKFKQFSMTIDGDTAEVVFVEIDTSERGNGLGLAAYEALGNALAAKGIVLQSSKAQYANGRSVWKKLAQKGLATKGAQGVYFFNQQTISESPEITQARKALAEAQERVRISRDAVQGVVTVDMPAIEARDQAQQALNSLLSSNTSIPSSVDIAANEAATSPQNNKPEPTPAQKEAGNYEMGHLTLGGMDISIENPAGSVRSGKDKDGETWQVTMASHYGYVKGSEGKDGDHIDIFITPGTPANYSGQVFVVNQMNDKGEFDEHKAVTGVGINSFDDARAEYLKNYSPGWKGDGSIAMLPQASFAKWVTERKRNGEAKSPFMQESPHKPKATKTPTPKASNQTPSSAEAPQDKAETSAEYRDAQDKARKALEGLFAPARTANDADYLAAVEAGDMETAQRMVNDAALSNATKVTRHTEEKTDTPLDGTYRVDVDGILYRTVTQSDWDRIESQGFLDSDQRNAVSRNEGVNLANNALSSITYAIPGEDSVLLGIKPEGIGLHGYTDDSYIRTWDKIPYDSIIPLGKFIGQETKPSYLADITYDESGNVIPLSQRFNTQSDDIRFSLAPRSQQDADYLAAVEAGDMETAQRMVDAAAKAAGYDREAFKAMPEKDWRTDEPINVINSTNGPWAGFFTDTKGVADRFGRIMRQPVRRAFLKLTKPFEVDASGKAAGELQFDILDDSGTHAQKNNAEILAAINSGSYDSIILKNTVDEGTVIVPLDPNQIKSADPVTYDDQGNVIPLSQRFDAGSDSILYAPARSSAKITHTFDDGYALTGAGLHEISAPVRAFHGTPHKVDKLRMSKVGTGEGAQAYGWGLYFAENEGVAKSYADAINPLAGINKDAATAARNTARSLGGRAKAIAWFENMLEQNADAGEAYRAETQAKIDWLRNATDADISGNLYTVELLPDESEFLDWDKPISEQSNPKLAALRKAHRAFLADPAQRISDKGKNGDSLYHMLERQKGSAKAASEYLASIGIPGIKYLDGNSRDNGKGTRNYVIFDENLVRILEENGKPVDPILSPARASTNIEQLAVPENRTDAIIQTARSIIAAKIRTPEGLAAFLDDTFAGKARGYSEAIWDAIGMVDKTLRGTHDWNAIYAKIDSPQEAPTEEKPTPKDFNESALDLSETIASRIRNKESTSLIQLSRLAEEAFGGKVGESFEIKDAYDAVEMAINTLILDSKLSVNATAEQAAINLQTIRGWLEFIPTQTRRTAEMDALQQFSTPPHFSYIAAWTAALNPTDVSIEPSAGLGGLAAWVSQGGRTVYLNELSDRRRGMLDTLHIGPPATGHDAGSLHAILLPSINSGKMKAPTISVMNPPFSNNAAGRKDLLTGAKHIEEMLKLLTPGGRLVAIVGEGMALDAPTYKPWWDAIRSKYSVRANIHVDGREYMKYGTTFSNRILVIDKVAPETDNVVTGEVKTIEELIPLLDGVRNTRPKLNDNLPNKPQSPDQSSGNETPQDGVSGDRTDDNPANPTTGKAGTRPGGRRGRTGGASASNSKRGGDGRSDEQTSSSDQPAGNIDATDQRLGGENPGGNEADSGPRLTADTEDVADAVIDEAEIFSEYRPRKTRIKGAKSHPSQLVESSSMATVEPPNVQNLPNLPQNVVESGGLSDAQLEAIAYAAQAHDVVFEDGRRQGFFIGDGTGVGKGREIAGTIIHNWREGRRKAVWISEKKELVKDARRDLDGTGGKDIPLVDMASKAAAPVGDGIAFMTYEGLKSNFDGLRDDGSIIKAKGDKAARIENLIKWLGKDFDGVIALDEVHNAGNVLAIKGARGFTKPATVALRVVDVQKVFPNARVLYVSATGATEPNNIAFAERLGLWGQGKAFSSVQQFYSSIKGAGLSAMEIFARDLKAMGLYIARTLSFKGVGFQRLEHQLTPAQSEIYSKAAEGWQTIFSNLSTVLNVTRQGNSSGARSAAASAFWSGQQRFFNNLLTSLQMPSVLADMRKRLDEDGSIVIQLVNTNEAALDRALNRAAAENSQNPDYENLDLSNRQDILEYIYTSFPVQKFHEVSDGTKADGSPKTKWVPMTVLDENGLPVPVLDPQAVEIRDRLIDEIALLKLPDPPLEQIINAFGHDAVAEITGRKRRLITRTDESGRKRKVLETQRNDARLQSEKDEFLQGKRRILMFSNKGGTGFSYHAGKAFKNQQRRFQYVIQAGWTASKAIQGLGRTHRADQVTPPFYILASTNVRGHQRFISTIARRLQQLGALTSGDRKSSGQGLFRDDDNLEDDYGQNAVTSLFFRMFNGGVEGLNFDDVSKRLGYSRTADDGSSINTLIDQTGALNQEKIPDIRQFLNRILALPIDEQNRVFDAFMEVRQQLIERAQKNGTYDIGVETFDAPEAETVSDDVVYEDAKTSAKTRLKEISYKRYFRFNSFDQVKGKDSTYVRNRRTGKVFAFQPTGSVLTSEDGSVERAYWRYGVMGMEKVPESALRDKIGKAPGFAKVGDWIPGVNGPQTYKIVSVKDGEAMVQMFKSNGEPATDYNGNPLAEMRTTTLMLSALHQTTGNVIEGVNENANYLPNNYELTEDEASKLWEKEHESSAKFEELRATFIVGTIIPLWHRIPAFYKKVRRVKMANGDTFLGVEVPEGAIDKTRRQLGAKAASLGPQAIIDAVLSRKSRVLLSNGWELHYVLSAGQGRIEVLGVDPAEWMTTSWDKWGDYFNGYIERINFKPRFFLTENVKGMDALLRFSPAMEVIGVDDEPINAPRLGIDDPEFAAALAEIEATLPSPAELAALHERAGIDWGASPTGDELAQLAQNRRWSSRAAYDEQREREQHDDWNEEARVIVDYNEKGAIRELASIASQGIGMTAVQTKTAQILLPRLTVRSIMNGDKQAFADAGTLTWGYDIAGTETARGLAARHQPHLSPEETHREFLAKAMFTPDRLTRERIRQAPSPDEKAERIAELEAELEQTRKDAVARERDMLSQMSAISNKMAEGKQAAMQKAKAALQSARAQAKADIAKLTDDLANVRKEKDKFQLLAEANEARLEEIRTAFADMGVTLEQVLITKEAKLAIQGTNVVKGVFAQFTERERKAVKHRLDGFSNRQIAKYTGISLSGLDAIFGKFDAALMSKFEAMAAQGITVEDFEAMDAAGNRIDIDKLIDKDGNLLAPARPTPTPEEIKTRAMAMFRAIMPSDEARKSGALKRTKGEQPGTEAPYGFDLSRPEHAAMLVRAINRLDSNGMDMVYEFWINGLLSGPSTQVANIAGNTGAALLEYGIQRPIAALVNATLFRDAAGPSLGEFQSMARYAGSAAATAFRFAKIAWQTEVTLFDSQWLNKPITVQGTSARGQIERFALPGKFGRVVRIPTRLLGMADEFAKNLVGQLEAAAQAHRIAKAEGLTGEAFDTRVDQLVRIPGSAAWIAAVEQAHKLTFTEELPDTMQKMQNVLHSKAKTPMGAVIKTLLRFIFPFVRTPYNIFKTGLRKTPLGTARMVGKGIAAWRGGRPFFDSYPKAAIATDLAEQLIGYMVTWFLIGAGEGDPDDDKKLLLFTGTRSRNDNIGEDQLLRRTRGGETSILWKGKPIFNYGRYEPFATVVATIVDAGREMKRVKGGTPVATAMKSAVFDVIDQARSKTFLQGFEGLMSLMDERSGKNPVDSAIKFIAQGIVPNLIRQPLRNVDNYARDTRNAPWYYSALPFGSLAEPLYDLYGRPVQKGGSPVSRLFMAEPDKQLPIETADKAMRAFAANHPLEAKFLSNPTRAAFRYKDAFGKFKDMTPQEAALYRKTAGQRFKVESAGVLPAPLAPTPEDITQLGNTKEKAFRDVKSEMFTGGVAPVIPPRKWPSLSEIFGQRLRQ